MGLQVGLSLYSHPDYDYFLDELYFLACSANLDFGFVDNPPLSHAILWLTVQLIGDAPTAIRVPSALTAALCIFVAGLSARRNGGGLVAQCIAMLLAFCPPLMLIYSVFFSMHIFEQLIWGLLGFVLMVILSGGDRRWWLVVGVLAGLGLQTRLTVGLFGLALTVALLLTPARSHFKSWHIWASGAIAFLIFLPHLWWLYRNDWPALEYVSNVQGVETFWTMLLLLGNPFTIPLWIGGVALVAWRAAYRPFLPIVLTAILSIGALGFFGGKAYYAVPALVMLAPFAGIAFAKAAKAWPKSASIYLVFMLGVSALFTHVAVPIFPMETYAPVTPALAGTDPEELSDVEFPFPLQLRVGWQDMAAFLAHRLEAHPEVHNSNTIIYSDYYGNAAALRHYGRDYGLPPVYSTHNQFYLWGPPDSEVDVAIIDLVFPVNLLLPFYFEEVRYVGTFEHAYMPQHLAIRKFYLCRGPLFDIAELWANLKNIS